MWQYNRRCNSKARLDGKIVVITGANTGIGKETARDFYRRGARVLLACRNAEKAKAAIEDIKNNPFPSRASRRQSESKLGELIFYSLDLSSLKSVRECARNLLARESAIHILVNNAGVMMCPYAKTEDGYEMHLQTNHLGHFLLTLLLLPKMKSSTPGCRIVNVSSCGQALGDIYLNDINLERWYHPLKGYAQSKLANILFTEELARRLEEARIEGINVYVLHPGVISTELSRHYDRGIIPGAKFFFNYIMWPFIKSVEQGAQTTIHCAVDEKAADQTGLYYAECRPTRSWRTRSKQTARDLWDLSCQLVSLRPDENLAILLETASRQIA